MKGLFGNLFGDGVARPTGHAHAIKAGTTATEVRTKLEEARQRAATPRGFGWVDPTRMYERALGLQDVAASPKYTMTAAQMLEWQKAQLEVQEARAAEEKRRAKEELEMPHNACSVSVAVDLWVVQYGDGWVYVGDIPETVGSGEMQWRELGKRLAGVNRMEARNNHWRIVT